MLIDALRGRPAAGRVRELALSTGSLFVCAINVEELWRGARRGDEESIRRLLQGLEMAPLGRREGERAGTWRRELSAAGVTLSQADCLVAAAAFGVGATLATGNPRHFPMPELRVEHWPVG